MEMVSKYLMLELKKNKEDLESKIFNLYEEMRPNNLKSDFNVKNQIHKIFPLNRYDESAEIILLLEETNQYINNATYNEHRQKNLKVKLEIAIKTIENL